MKKTNLFLFLDPEFQTIDNNLTSKESCVNINIKTVIKKSDIAVQDIDIIRNKIFDLKQLRVPLKHTHFQHT
jgi:hypothetical protein